MGRLGMTNFSSLLWLDNSGWGVRILSLFWRVQKTLKSRATISTRIRRKLLSTADSFLHNRINGRSTSSIIGFVIMLSSTVPCPLLCSIECFFLKIVNSGLLWMCDLIHTYVSVPQSHIELPTPCFFILFLFCIVIFSCCCCLSRDCLRRFCQVPKYDRARRVVAIASRS